MKVAARKTIERELTPMRIICSNMRWYFLTEAGTALRLRRKNRLMEPKSSTTTREAEPKLSAMSLKTFLAGKDF
jgi:hypothetical protein